MPCRRALLAALVAVLMAGVAGAWAEGALASRGRSAKDSGKSPRRVAATHSNPSMSEQARNTADRNRRKRASAARLRFGAHAPPGPEAGMDAVESLAQALSRPVEIVLWYQHWAGWGAAFEPSWVANVHATGRIPLLTWEPWVPGAGVDQPAYALARIADGEFDGYVESWAQALAGYGKAVYLRPMHEMNGDWYPWGGTVNGNEPADYVAAWRRMHGIFQRAGATNVRWVWSPYTEDVPATAANALERYYPGSRYVDVLALDGYNWGTGAPGHGGWRSFGTVFASSYARVARLGPQPIWIAEVGSAPEGGDKAAWVRDMFASAVRLPRLRAIVWFNVDKERDWRATSSPEVAAAFARPAG